MPRVTKADLTERKGQLAQRVKQLFELDIVQIFGEMGRVLPGITVSTETTIDEMRRQLILWAIEDILPKTY